MRIVSGMRPTGSLHLGHLHGALKNWVRLQDEGNECFYFVADWHALTTDYQKTENIPAHVRDMVADWLAAGLDPKKSVLFLQSLVPQHAELFLLLGMITPLGWLERNPTYKEVRLELSDRDLSNFGFLGYPVLQAADIIIYKADGVPVGQDQVPHLELTREITRRCNNFFGEIFPEPQALLTASPKIGGVDARKMSKSYDNAILIGDEEETVQSKIKVMVTDPKRARRKDPGDPDTCNLFPLHEVYSTSDIVSEVRAGCVSAGIGCVDCKKMLLSQMLPPMEAIRNRRKEILRQPDLVKTVLDEGSTRARIAAEKTMKEVRQAAHLSYD